LSDDDLKLPLSSALEALRLNADLVKSINTGITIPDIRDYTMPEMPEIKSIWETQAELYMEGLQHQAKTLGKGLKQDEELVMTCWHGGEKFQVLSVGMPSQNVVALKCVDVDGNHVQVTGHMNAVTFSFMVRKVQPPAKPCKIGFSIP
jgi:hypothetical protein